MIFYSKKIEKPKMKVCTRINEKKRERGECLTSSCEMECVEGNEFLFDMDHRNPEKKTIRVSQLVNKKWDYFNKQLPLEMDKCDLLCCGCHWIKTHY